MTGAAIRRLLIAAGRVPRHLAIGEQAPQQRVRVTLEGLDRPVDVTRNHVIAALQPLTIAIALPAGDSHGREPLRLRVSPRDDPETTLGALELRSAGALDLERTTLRLFRPCGYLNACMPSGARTVFALHHAWADWKRGRPRDFAVGSLELGVLQVLYMCPRPVVLVTTGNGAAGNAFPMDLVGPTDSPYFLLALRNTSRSLPLMRASERLTLADVPLEHAGAALQLGERHVKQQADGASSVQELPVLRDALGVRDIELEGAHVVGSHTLFIGRVIREERHKEGLQMSFISGSYYRRLILDGVPPVLPP